jgi:hypothetical protein
MKKIFYEKRGRRYYPTHEYDSEFIDSFPKGNHLVMSYPGGQSTRYNVNPNYAAMIAAGRVAEDKICAAIVKASELRPSKEPLTPGQVRAWNNLKKEFGDDMYGLRGVSIHDCVEAGIKAMMEEAESLMQNPAVKNAFDQFITLVSLAKKQESC